MERTIELSHWGNIAIEETIDMVHSGASLKGSFSRYDFQKDTRSGLASVKNYKTILPASATGVYYRFVFKIINNVCDITETKDDFLGSISFIDINPQSL